jgi:uncharacterized protein
MFKACLLIFVQSMLLLSFTVSSAHAQATAPANFAACPTPRGHCIATGNSKFTYFQIGKDLSEKVAPLAGVRLQPLESAGSADNVRRMRYQTGVKMAIVQSDVLLFYRNQADSGNAEARELVDPLRVMQPLYNEEVHILVRVDPTDPNAGLHFVHELENLRIAVGPQEGGSAMTAVLAYQLLFGKQPDPAQFYFSSVDDAMTALANGTVDAYMMVAGQPASRFASIAAEGRNFIRLLALDPAHPSTARLLSGPYYTTEIKASNYAWMEHDAPTFSVKAYLISQRYTNADTRKDITSLTKALCQKLPDLQVSAHAKWKQVSISTAPLPGGWKYSDDAMVALRSPECSGTAAGTTPQACTAIQKVLLTPGCG